MVGEDLSGWDEGVNKLYIFMKEQISNKGEELKKEYHFDEKNEYFSIIFNFFPAMIAGIVVYFSFLEFRSEGFYGDIVPILFVGIFSIIFFKFYIDFFKKISLRKKYRSRESFIEEISYNQDVSMKEARSILDEKNRIRIEIIKEDEISGDFLKVFQYIEKTIEFYIWSIFSFLTIAVLCLAAIYFVLQSNNLYKEVGFYFTNELNQIIHKTAGQIFMEGFFKNIRFFIYESILITLLAFCLKKISNYISMIEVYKEWKVLLIMDIQRQYKTANENERGIVSKEFQHNFTERLKRHEECLLNNKENIEIKTTPDRLNGLFSKTKK